MANVNQTKTKAIGVSKLDNGKFLADWKDQFGKRQRVQCPTFLQAKKLRAEGEADKWAGRHDSASARRAKDNILFDGLVKDRLELIKDLASFEGEAGRINWWRQRFKNRLVSSISYQDVNKALVDLLESRKPSTRNLYFSTVKAIYALAIQNDKVGKSPCIGIKRLKENNKVISWMDIGDERKLMAVKEMAEEFKLTVIIALNTGLRVSEQMPLRRDDLDFRSRQITLRETKSGETQFQPMNSIAYEAFRRLIAMMPTHISGEVFHFINQYKGYKKTRNYYKLNYAWRKYCDLAGIKKYRWHDLRHTFASRMVINGESIVVVQRLMRHADVSTTMRYVHLAPRNIEDALSRLSNWYDKPDNWQEIDTQVPSRMPSTGTVND